MCARNAYLLHYSGELQAELNDGVPGHGVVGYGCKRRPEEETDPESAITVAYPPRPAAAASGPHMDRVWPTYG